MMDNNNVNPMESSWMDEENVTKRLFDVVQQLVSKVARLEDDMERVTAGLAQATAGLAQATAGTTGRSRDGGSRKHGVLARLNGLGNEGVTPSMSMKPFLEYLARMPCDAESVTTKTSAEVLADLVTDGIRNLRKQQPGFVPPLTSVPECPGVLFLFGDAPVSGPTAIGEWSICSPVAFSQFTARVHACVVIQCNRWREKNVGPPRPLYSESNPVPNPVRDPRAMAKHHNIITKIYSLNLSSGGLMSRTKKLVCASVSAAAT